MWILDPVRLGSNLSSVTEEPRDFEAGCFISLCLSFFISRMRVIIALPLRVVVKMEDVNIRKDLEQCLVPKCV